jgi:hypothetical protein
MLLLYVWLGISGSKDCRLLKVVGFYKVGCRKICQLLSAVDWNPHSEHFSGDSSTFQPDYYMEFEAFKLQ